MALQDQVSIRLEGQILLEVAREGEQCRLLAGEQAAGDGTVLSGLSGGEVNAMQREALFKLLLFNCRLHGDLGGCVSFTTAAVAHVAGDCVISRSKTFGIELSSGACACYVAATSFIAIRQLVIVRVSGG